MFGRSDTQNCRPMQLVYSNVAWIVSYLMWRLWLITCDDKIKCRQRNRHTAKEMKSSRAAAAAKAIMYVDLLALFSHCFVHVKLKSRTNCVMCQLRYSLEPKLISLRANKCHTKWRKREKSRWKKDISAIYKNKLEIFFITRVRVSHSDCTWNSD